MTGRELVRALEKYKELVIPWLSELLIQSGIKDVEVIEKVVPVEKVTVVKPEELTKLEEELKQATDDVKGQQETMTQLDEQNQKLIAENKTLADQVKTLETNVQRNMSDKDRAALRGRLNTALINAIASDSATAAKLFIELQVEVSKRETLKDKLEVIDGFEKTLQAPQTETQAK